MGRPALRQVAPEDDALDTAEVPAAVVCARCGSPDCLGCGTTGEEVTLPSGVIPIIPWERPFGSAWSRMWSTALAATQSTEKFFGPISKGEYGAALRFSVICELLAIGSVAVVLAAIVVAVAPGVALELVHEPNARGLLVRFLLLTIPSFAALLVIVHVIYGWAMDWGARRVGARAHRSQALRFGMYSTGLDLVTSPLGLTYALFKLGPRGALRLLPAAIEVPSLAATTLLVRVYHLAEAPARRARRLGSILVSIVGLTMVVAVMAMIAAAMLL